MQISSLARCAAGVALAGALLAACSSGSLSGGLGPSVQPPNGREIGFTPMSAQRALTLTMAHYRAGWVRPDCAKSWMEPNVSKSLLYIADDGSNDTYVLDYPSGKLVGTLTGFDYPYGLCVDKKGDVYISNFDNGELIEYPPGGNAPINTYADSGGYLIGCSISATGDVSATAFETSNGYGNVCIWKGGKGSPTCIDGSSSTNCYYLWTFGYDHKGNLVGEGEYSGISECMIPAGGSSMEKLSTSGITIDFAGGTQWDGKYIGLGDQEAEGTYKTGVWASTLSGSTLTPVGSEIVFLDNCYSDYADIVNPFFFDKGNVTAASTKRATRFVGANLWCYDEGKPGVSVWKYPKGGLPIKTFTNGLTEPYGVAVSIAK